MAQQLVDHQHPGDDDVGPFRVEAGDRAAGLLVLAGEHRQQVNDLRVEHLVVVDRVELLLAQRHRHAADAGHRPPGADQRLDRQLIAGESGAQHLAHVFAQPLQVGVINRVVGEVLLGEDHGAEFHGVDFVDVVTDHGDDLDAAAADVDQQGAPAAEIEVVAGAARREVGLLLAADDADGDAGGRGHRRQEFLAVGRPAHRAGGHRLDGADGEPVEDLLHPLQGLQGPVPGRRLDAAAGGQPFAEAHRRLFVVEDAEFPAGGGFDDDAADRVGADVDGGEALGMLFIPGRGGGGRVSNCNPRGGSRNAATAGEVQNPHAFVLWACVAAVARCVRK